MTNQEAFQLCLDAFHDAKEGDGVKGEFHSAAYRALPRHLYQLLSFYHLAPGSSFENEVKSKRRLNLSDHLFGRYCRDIQDLVGAQCIKSGLVEKLSKKLDSGIDKALAEHERRTA